MLSIRVPAREEEDGFTIVELLVAMAVMSIVVAATMSVLFRAFTTNTITLSRTQQQGDGRVAMERMSKQIRQATSVTTGDHDEIVFNTYIDGVPKVVDWRTTTGGDLEYRVGTSGPYATMVSGLASPNIFDYQPLVFDGTIGGQLDQVIITLQLETREGSATIPLKTTVSLRNS